MNQKTLTPMMKTALECLEHNAFIVAGMNKLSTGGYVRIHAPTLMSLAKRGVVELYLHQDGGMAARKVNHGDTR